jgi:hypothetical protein
LKRHPTWPDRHRQLDRQSLFSLRLKRLFSFGRQNAPEGYVDLSETLARAWPDRALLCATVAAGTMEEQVAARDRLAARADLVEMRLDAACS